MWNSMGTGATEGTEVESSCKALVGGMVAKTD